MRVVLVGNQNSGKTTLFNALTGMRQKVGNWPGVTIAKKEGIIPHTTIELIDLPGVYSLEPYTLEEKVSCDYLQTGEYDCIVNVVDATCLERGLFLTKQLLLLHHRMIVVLTKTDQLVAKGIQIYQQKLEQLLRVKVVTLSRREEEAREKMQSLLYTVAKENEDSILQSQRGFDRKTQIQKQYEEVDKICHQCVHQTFARSKWWKDADKIFLHPLFAIPIFLGIITGIYFIAMNVVGSSFSKMLQLFLLHGKEGMRSFLLTTNTSPWLISLLCDGVITGVGSVLQFLPELAVVFSAMSFLEASGYMARVSFLLDSILRRFGLNGKSMVSFLLGTGCSVPGILSSKVIEEEKTRNRTIAVTPFIPCSAKLPMIALFSSCFFPYHRALVAVSFYLLAVGIVLASASIMRFFSKEKEETLYLFELPSYQFPKGKILWRDVKQKCEDFMHKAGTVIFLSSVLLWCVLSFSPQLQFGVNIEESILAFCGKKIAWVLQPIIGVESWEATVSTLQGLIAKEQVIASMEMIHGLSAGKEDNIFTKNGTWGFFEPASAYAFVAFNLFSLPCMVALITMKKEFSHYQWFWSIIAYQLSIGWVLSVCLRRGLLWILQS